MIKITSILLLLFSSTTFAINFGNIAEDLINKSGIQTTTSTLDIGNKQNQSNMESDIVSQGLKQALKQGIEVAVKNLGKENSFLSNKKIKIPLPDKLAKAESLIRKAGGDKVANDFILSMNTAATKAVPQTTKILVDAVSNMHIDDAKRILSGGDTAASHYFKEKTSAQLKQMILPIIQNTMAENKVAHYYKMVNELYKTHGKGLVEKSGLMGYAKQFGVDSYLPGDNDENIDSYVTNKTIDGLFTMIAEKEKEIRQNPVARSTDLLKKVFGK